MKGKEERAGRIDIDTLRRGDSLAQWSYSEPIRGVLLASSVRLGKTLGAINPEVLNCVATAASETLGCYDKPVIEPPGNVFPSRPIPPQGIAQKYGTHQRFSGKTGQSN
jgi:hypothetical protein